MGDPEEDAEDWIWNKTDDKLAAAPPPGTIHEACP
jgi:hypothetical protein